MMTLLTQLALQSYHQSLPPTVTCLQSSTPTSSKFSSIRQNLIQSNISRRIAATTAILLAGEAILNPHVASCFEFRMTVPDQTTEEAENGIKAHAQDLLNVKALIDSESWREAQKALRKSSSLLKQDIYTLIQAKPGSERPLLRKLYSDLFNNVTGLDYAARSKDVTCVLEYYENIVVALDSILSRL